MLSIFVDVICIFIIIIYLLQTNLHIFGVIEGATAMIMQEDWEKLFNSRGLYP